MDTVSVKSKSKWRLPENSLRRSLGFYETQFFLVLGSFLLILLCYLMRRFNCEILTWMLDNKFFDFGMSFDVWEASFGILIGLAALISFVKNLVCLDYGELDELSSNLCAISCIGTGCFIFSVPIKSCWIPEFLVFGFAITLIILSIVVGIWCEMAKVKAKNSLKLAENQESDSPLVRQKKLYYIGLVRIISGLLVLTVLAYWFFFTGGAIGSWLDQHQLAYGFGEAFTLVLAMLVALVGLTFILSDAWQLKIAIPRLHWISILAAVVVFLAIFFEPEFMIYEFVVFIFLFFCFLLNAVCKFSIKRKIKKENLKKG